MYVYVPSQSGQKIGCKVYTGMYSVYTSKYFIWKFHIITRGESYQKCYPKSVWNRCALPELRLKTVKWRLVYNWGIDHLQSHLNDLWSTTVKRWDKYIYLSEWYHSTRSTFAKILHWSAVLQKKELTLGGRLPWWLDGAGLASKD
jgi:hypothetical protein